jgi:CPA1 family monovalent cation:H+ antiporter
MTLFQVLAMAIAVVALCGYFNYRWVRLPDTIGITATALGLSLITVLVGIEIPAVSQWAASVMRCCARAGPSLCWRPWGW